MVKLSIIIPAYNAEPYISHLINTLKPQITPEVEVIVVDDGSREVFKTEHSWVKVIRQDNGGVSKARNRGLEEATGEYIAFIDADDLVSENYISTLFSKMPFDVLEMSWKSLPGGKQFAYSLTSDNDCLRNPSAVTRAFKRSVIGTIRFNENKQAAEDVEFVREIYKTAKQISVAKDYLYFYRTSTPNSLSKRYSSGDTETKRIVYHYKRITWRHSSCPIPPVAPLMATVLPFNFGMFFFIQVSVLITYSCIFSSLYHILGATATKTKKRRKNFSKSVDKRELLWYTM